MPHALLRASFIAPFLLLTACGQASNQTMVTSEAAQQAEIVSMGAFPRAEMARVNAASFATSDAAIAQPVAAPESAPAAAAAGTTLAPPAQPALDPSIDPNAANYDAALVRIQVLLDRAHFSPGVIDGFDGENVVKAVSAYQSAHALEVNGRADDALLQTLAAADSAQALTPYVISAADIAGPFVATPTDLEAMSALDHIGYASVTEALAEKFHMDEDFLRTLNPGADFARAGTEILVANAGGDLPAAVAMIEIDKPGRAVRAYDAQNQIIAYYPATIGSSEAPAPRGEFQVRAIAFDPTYHYDPERLPTFGQRDHGALDVAAGPNNPVGAIWIALSLETYGIHGAPDPSTVSKSQSHGCVRLTNWDALELGHAVRAGVPVNFLERSADAMALRAA